MNNLILYLKTRKLKKNKNYRKLTYLNKKRNLKVNVLCYNRIRRKNKLNKMAISKILKFLIIKQDKIGQVKHYNKILKPNCH